MTKEFHHAFEILIVLDGTQETCLEKDRYVIQKNEILLIPLVLNIPIIASLLVQ